MIGIVVCLALVYGVSVGEYEMLRQQLVEYNRDAREQVAMTLMDHEAAVVLDKWKRDAQESQTAFREPFLQPHIKSRIENTTLFDFLDGIPKGGVLHLHEDSMGDVGWVTQSLLDRTDCFIKWNEDDADHGYTWCGLGSPPSGYITAAEIDHRVPAFRSKMARLLMLQHVPTRSSKESWEAFAACFMRLQSYLRYLPAAEGYFYNAFTSLESNGVQHVEIRMNVLRDYSDETGPLEPLVVAARLQHLVKAFQEQYPHFTVQFILYSQRLNNIEEARQDMETAFQLRKAYPRLFVGFDLVGREGGDRAKTERKSTSWFLPLWLETVPGLENEYGVSMPLFLHDGESDWQYDSNLIDAVLLNSTRIGHGINLFYYPLLEPMLRDLRIPLEVSPISNQVLGYVSDLRIHPAAGYLYRGIPIVLSSDDPMIYGYTGMTYDLWMATAAWNLELADIKTLAYNSIVFSSLESHEKALERWNQQWDAFIRDTLSASM